MEMVKKAFKAPIWRLERFLNQVPFYQIHKKHNPLLRFITTGLYDFLVHEFYWLLTTVKYRMSSASRNLSPEARYMAESLSKEGYALMPEGALKEKSLRGLDELWAKFDAFQQTHSIGYWPDPVIKFKGMLAYPAKTPNQVHYDQFTKSDEDAVAKFLVDSGCHAAICEFEKSHVSAHNIRMWRYFHFPGARQGNHRDNLPPHGLKVLLYRGDVDGTNGGLQVQDYNGKRFIVSGKNQIFVCDVNRLWHESDCPEPGRIRDALEISFLPDLAGEFRCRAAGPDAAQPLNPFRDWFTPQKGIVPYKFLGRKTPMSIGK